METRYSSNQVVAMTGITPRQLQWWDERGIVKPARDGHRRLYSFEDIAEISVICELRSRGFSLQRVRKVMRWIQKEMGRRLVEVTAANSEIHLLTDGKHIFLEDSERGVIDVLKNSRQPLLAVCLSDAVERVRGEMRSQGLTIQPRTERAKNSTNAKTSKVPVADRKPVRRQGRVALELRSALRNKSSVSRKTGRGSDSILVGGNQ